MVTCLSSESQQFNKEKMHQLCEELLLIEEDRTVGSAGVSVKKLDSFLDDIISKTK